MKSIKEFVIKNRKLSITLFLGIIVLTTYFAFKKVQKAELTNWDDNHYILENPAIKKLSKENLTKIFSEPYLGNYHPLTTLSFAINYNSGKTNPKTYHRDNLILHILNSFLVFWLILLLFKQPSIAAFIAILFGIHTLHVESVAWVSERKDVLYSFFFLFSLIFYWKWTFSKKYLFYFSSLLLFILSLLSKGMAAALAPTLMLLDFYKGRKIFSWKILSEKIPFFILAIIFGIVAVNSQTVSTENLSGSTDYHFFERIAFAGFGFINYFLKFFYPWHLAVIYPYPFESGSIPLYFWLYPLAAILIATAAFYSLKFSRIYFFAFMFFLLNIALVLQLIPVGEAVMADRYTYISSIGFFIAFAFFIKELTPGKDLWKIIAGIAYLALLFTQTQKRCDAWQNSLSLWDDQIKKYPSTALAFYNRGLIKGKKGDHQGSLHDFNAAIKIKPAYCSALADRGMVFSLLKDTSAAIKSYTDAISCNQNFLAAFRNRGHLRLNKGDYKGAIEDFSKAVELKAEATFYCDRGIAKYHLNDTIGALSDYNKAIDMDPGLEMCFINRGCLFLDGKNFEAAISDFNRALEINRQSGLAFFNRGVAKYNLGDKSGCCEDVRKSLQAGYRQAENVLKIVCP